MQALSTQLAQITSAHKAEQAAHAATREELAEANKAVAARKSGLDQALTDHAQELQAQREAAATALSEARSARLLHVLPKARRGPRFAVIPIPNMPASFQARFTCLRPAECCLPYRMCSCPRMLVPESALLHLHL